MEIMETAHNFSILAIQIRLVPLCHAALSSGKRIVIIHLSEDFIIAVKWKYANRTKLKSIYCSLMPAKFRQTNGNIPRSTKFINDATFANSIASEDQ